MEMTRTNSCPSPNVVTNPRPNIAVATTQALQTIQVPNPLTPTPTRQNAMDFSNLVASRMAPVIFMDQPVIQSPQIQPICSPATPIINPICTQTITPAQGQTIPSTPQPMLNYRPYNNAHGYIFHPLPACIPATLYAAPHDALYQPQHTTPYQVIAPVQSQPAITTQAPVSSRTHENHSVQPGLHACQLAAPIVNRGHIYPARMGSCLLPLQQPAFPQEGIKQAQETGELPPAPQSHTQTAEASLARAAPQEPLTLAQPQASPRNESASSSINNMASNNDSDHSTDPNSPIDGNQVRIHHPIGIISSLPKIGDHTAHPFPSHIQDIQVDATLSSGSMIDMDDQERKKQERKRERNRIAAAKCRERKMTKISTLEAEVRTLQQQIKNYVLERDYYRNRCTKIVELVNLHIKNGDTRVPIAGIQKIIETVTEEERNRMSDNSAAAAAAAADNEPAAKYAKTEYHSED